jgi:hypothetical protein
MILPCKQRSRKCIYVLISYFKVIIIFFLDVQSDRNQVNNDTSYAYDMIIHNTIIFISRRNCDIFHIQNEFYSCVLMNN